jgi:protein sidekick
LNQQINIIEQQPIFTSQPVDVGPLFSGTRGILQCTASGTPQVQYRWLKNGASLTNRSTSNGGVYLISQADRYKDCGLYQCIAENKLGSVLSNKAQLTVAYMDQLKAQYPVEIRVRYGRAAIIRLPKMFDAYPAPTIEWFAGGALIEPNAKFAITKDYNLVVLKCDKADEKSYYVEVSSIHTGTKIRSREIRLYIIDSYNFDEDASSSSNMFSSFNSQDDYAAAAATSQDNGLSSDGTSGGNPDLEFIVKPVDTIAKLNDNLVKFDCIVNSRKYALDQLEISWYKDQQLIDFIKTKYHLSSRSLEIISVTDQDVGVYMCSARYNINPMTSSSSFFGSSSSNVNSNYVSINASAKLEVYIKPTFKNQPESLIETDFGKTVQLKCDGIAYPPANITWYKNAQLIDFDKQINIQSNDSGTKLIINNISVKDQAIYQCFLSNEAGHISASTLIKIISFAPKFVDPIENMTVYSDSNIELPCSRVDGSPRPRITWTKVNMNLMTKKDQHNGGGGGGEDEAYNPERLVYGEEVYSSSDEDDYYSRNRENTDLMLRNVNVRNQGWYRCEASNLMGKICANFYLQIKSMHSFLLFKFIK